MPTTCSAYARQQESKLSLALSELKASKQYCDQLNKEIDDNEKVLLEDHENNRKLKMKWLSYTINSLNFWSLIENYNFDATTIYNMDETGIMSSTSRPPKVLSIKGKRQVGVICSAERGPLTTVVCCCNAAGTFVPPFFIFARKRMQERVLDR
ncbi:hypothetical protein PYW07_006247 [Mythimna separata]|uniref:Uncharacterized protein n=1 Tax=Mythimna separata TaxID=271217 RepID=A0AAD7YU56_MYTSE|nr:hypothetical protein PYW07_006247 [Mythimna separata]